MTRERIESYYHPWIGENFEDGFCGVRTLVLGESHYCWEDYKSREETRNVVRMTIKYGPDNNFWRRVTIGFLGAEPHREEIARLWNSVAFYNFVQEPMEPPPARSRPTAKQWQAAAAPFKSVITGLKPQLITVFGRRVWHNLPCNGRNGRTLRADGYSAETYLYPIEGVGEALAVSFRHPSAGFGGYSHHSLLQKAVQEAGRLHAVGAGV